MGNFFKPTSTTTKATSTPWGPQADQLKSAFGDAQGLYDQQKGTPFYSGDLYAGMNPLTDQGIQANNGYATGAGAQAAGNVLGSGQGMLGQGQNAASSYGQLQGMASQDPTHANITDAGAYANNPFLNSQIDAASRDVMRNLTENQIPGLNMGATGSGNMDSSRAGIAQGVLERGAAQQVGDISANMRGQAYENGLNQAENARQANMGMLGYAGMGQGGLYNEGLYGTELGNNLNYGNNNAQISDGQLYQQDKQGQDNANFQQWQGQQQFPWQQLDNYMGVVGSNNWGGTQTQSVPGASPFQTLLGTAVSGLGAYMGAGGKFSDPRLKDCIVKIGERPDGLGIYSFKYRQDRGIRLPTGTQVGFMADEVLRVRPDAVGHRNGYLTVDYGKLT